MFNANSYRNGRAFGALFLLIAGVGAFHALKYFDGDTTVWNRSSKEGSPQRQTIEALLLLQSGDLRQSSWSTICHQDVCQEGYASFVSSELQPAQPLAADCLLPGEKIELLGTQIRNSNDQMLNVRCADGEFWLQIRFRRHHPKTIADSAPAPWLIVAMQRLEDRPL